MTHNWYAVLTGNPESQAMMCRNKGCKATAYLPRLGADQKWSYTDSDGRNASHTDSKCTVSSEDSPPSTGPTEPKE
jgi:hypothetical protein